MGALNLQPCVQPKGVWSKFGTCTLREHAQHPLTQNPAYATAIHFHGNLSFNYWRATGIFPTLYLLILYMLNFVLFFCTAVYLWVQHLHVQQGLHPAFIYTLPWV